MENAQDAAIGFARKLRPQDLAQVVDFDSRVEIKLGFTNKVEELESAIHATSAGGSTALHNAVYIALKELAKIKAKNPDAPDVYDTQIQFPPLPRQMSVAAALRLALSQVPEFDVSYIVRNGVLENLAYSRFWAERQKRQPTPGR